MKNLCRLPDMRVLVCAVLLSCIAVACGGDSGSVADSTVPDTMPALETTTTAAPTTDSSVTSNSSVPSSTATKFKNPPTIVHKFVLNAMSIQMWNSDRSLCVQPCKGYYLGWNANFKDEKRKIIYSSEANDFRDIIAGLLPGDKGELLVMYQANQSAMPQIAARYPFSFKGATQARYDSGVTQRLSYEYDGNSIKILLKDANGTVCPQPCSGYYLGWEADFNDADRQITYSNSSNGYTDTIGNLRVGDSGDLLLMYDDAGTPAIRGRVPFIYLG